MRLDQLKMLEIQEAFEKCWAHSPLRAAARCLFYIAIHQVSLLSHAATVARRLRIDVHNNIDDNAWQRGPLWPHGMGPINLLLMTKISKLEKCAVILTHASGRPPKYTRWAVRCGRFCKKQRRAVHQRCAYHWACIRVMSLSVVTNVCNIILRALWFNQFKLRRDLSQMHEQRICWHDDNWLKWVTGPVNRIILRKCDVCFMTTLLIYHHHSILLYLFDYITSDYVTCDVIRVKAKRSC